MSSRSESPCWIGAAAFVLIGGACTSATKMDSSVTDTGTLRCDDEESDYARGQSMGCEPGQRDGGILGARDGEACRAESSEADYPWYEFDWGDEANEACNSAAKTDCEGACVSGWYDAYVECFMPAYRAAHDATSTDC